MKLKAIKTFRDKEDKKTVYKEGDTLTVENLDRINDLVSRGLCIITSVETDDDSGSADKIKFQEKEFEIKAVKDALISIGVTVANNAGATSINKKLSELTEDQSKALAEILCKE